MTRNIIINMIIPTTHPQLLSEEELLVGVDAPT